MGEIEDEYVLRRVIHYGFSLAQSGRLSQARDVLELAYARAEVLAPPSSVRVVAVELAHIELESGRPERALAASGKQQQARALLPEIRSATGQGMHPEDLERLLAQLDEDPPAR